MLCKECRTHFHLMAIGHCNDCGGMTSSISLQICKDCSVKLKECQECRIELAADEQDDK